MTSFDDLLVSIQRLMDGDNVSVSAIERATLLQIVEMAETRIYSDVRSRHNEKAFSGLTVTGNRASIPADFEAVSVIHFGNGALEPVSEEWLRAYNQNSAGQVRYYAESGSAWEFGPAVSDGTAVQGRYYYRLPALSPATFSANTLIAAEPTLFLFAALAEGVAFFSKDPAYWEAKYQAVKDRLNTAKERAAYSSGRIRVKPSVSVIEGL